MKQSNKDKCPQRGKLQYLHHILDNLSVLLDVVQRPNITQEKRFVGAWFPAENHSPLTGVYYSSKVTLKRSLESRTNFEMPLPEMNDSSDNDAPKRIYSRCSDSC